MKKFLMLFILIAMVGCSKADFVSWEKNKQSDNQGLKRQVTVYSAYTGMILFQKKINHSYFSGTSSNGTDIDILDLETKMKLSIIGNNAIIIIEEVE